MTHLEFSAEFGIFPNDPDLWRVFRDRLLDDGDEPGADRALVLVEFWQTVRDKAWEPFWWEYDGHEPTGGVWAWANPSESGRGDMVGDGIRFPFRSHPCHIEPPALFKSLPKGDYGNPGFMWIVGWKTLEGAWLALEGAWLKWRGVSSLTRSLPRL
jgi:hypothetical protein